MKKFNALLFAMALVAVVAFASVAFAATQFLGVDTNGKVVVINVDPTKTSQKVTYEGYTITGAPKIGDDGHSTVKAFGYEGGIVVVSTDALDGNNNGAKVYTFTTNDSGNFEYGGKSYSGRISGDIRDVLTMDGNPVIVATKTIATVSNDKLIAFKISADLAFQYNSKLYVVSGDGANNKGQIFEFSGIPDDSDHWNEKTEIYGLQLAESSYVKSRDIGITSPVTVVNGATSTVVMGDAIYIATGKTSANGGSFDMIAIPTATNSFMDTTGLSIKKVDSTFVSETGEYYALFEKGDALYALAAAADKDLYLSKLSMNSDKTAFTKAETILSGLKSKLYETTPTIIDNISCDIYIADDVIGIVNHGHALAIFTENSEGGWDFVESRDFLTAAMATTASSTDDGKKEETTTSTVVDATKITDETQVANLTKASGASGTSAFVAQSDVTESTGTAPSTDTQTAVKEKAGFDNSTVAAVKDYTLAKKGYVLVTTNPGYNAANVKVYFVKKASSSSASVAAAEESFTASLLDSSYAAISTGTSAYATSTSELEAGDYTLVTVTKTASGEGEGEGESGSTTSSSSGGCNAGFAAVSALLALAFVKKSR